MRVEQVGGVTIVQGDAIESLRLLDDKSVNCCVTSPPYWGLRDYGVTGQLGLESTPQEYVEKMVAVFREVRRVLRDDGTLWLNLGDSYAANAKGSGGTNSTTIGGGKGQTTNVGSFYDRKFDLPLSGLKPKDLVGIPWRVAFALQAPDYLGNIRSETDRAWLAALVDGEGCITVLEATSPHGSGSSYPPVLQVRMCDIECIAKAAQITGYGMASPPQEPPSQIGQRASYQWRLHGRKAADTIAEIYPFLLIKRKQAIVAWNLQAVRDGYETKRGVKIPADDLAKQLVCRDLAQRLNKREPVDIPSWMIEPPQPFGPGWYLRQDLIWAKPNPMPESVRDRCTKSHEYLFLLAKSEKYYCDMEAIKEPETMKPQRRLTSVLADPTNKVHDRPQYRRAEGSTGGGTRNKRSVWTVTTKPHKEAHFATFPPDLIEPCVLAGTSEKGCCPHCGAGWKRITSRGVESRDVDPSELDRFGDGSAGVHRKVGGQYQKWLNENPLQTTGWAPTCMCPAHEPIPAVVLDPFGGAGTTGLVAQRHGRQAVLLELNPAYIDLTVNRIKAG